MKYEAKRDKTAGLLLLGQPLLVVSPVGCGTTEATKMAFLQLGFSVEVVDLAVQDVTSFQSFAARNRDQGFPHQGIIFMTDRFIDPDVVDGLRQWLDTTGTSRVVAIVTNNRDVVHSDILACIFNQVDF